MKTFNERDNKEIQQEIKQKENNIQKSSDDVSELKAMVNNLTMALIVNGIDVENL